MYNSLLRRHIMRDRHIAYRSYGDACDDDVSHNGLGADYG